jgi:hypothetical protein
MKTWRETYQGTAWAQIAQETPEATILHVISSELLTELSYGNQAGLAGLALSAAVCFREESRVPPELLAELEAKLKQRKAISETIAELNRKLPPHLQRQRAT